MRVRNIKIAIKSDTELFNEIKEVCGKLERGEKVKKHEGVSFKNIFELYNCEGCEALAKRFI